MKEKKFYAYEEARIVKDSGKWYINYKQTNPSTNKLERKRPTFKINRIKDLEERQKEAEKWVRYVNARLPFGYPFKSLDNTKEAYEDLVDHINQFLSSISVMENRNRAGEQLILDIKKILPNAFEFIDEEDPKNTPIFEALDFYEDKVYPDLADNTINNRNKFITDIREYLDKKKIKNLAVGKFTILHAKETMAYTDNKRKINNNSYNYQLENAITVFSYFEDNDFILKGRNPFKPLKKKDKKRKERRNISAKEKVVIKKYLIEKDYQLYLAAMLQYCCYIRPSALQQLRFEDFNFQLGIIRVKDEIVKTCNTKHVTIPKDILPLFVAADFKNNPPHWYVFGTKCKPGPKRIEESLMRVRHLRYIRKLKQDGLLEHITGIQWYSWKDTGITDALKQIKGYWVQKQADHQNYSTTQKYDHAGIINEGMRNFKIDF